MSREIKFRAWDKANRKMLEVSWMDWREWQIYVSDTLFGRVERNSFKNEKTDEHILMQHTGLKDVNDKGIYEGDIVFRVPSEYDPPWVEPEILQVIWHTESASFVCGDVHGGCCPMDEDGWQVVGNVYENPELLGGCEE